MRTITAPLQWKASTANMRGRISFDGLLDSTNYGHIQSDVISGTTYAVASGLTISSVQATTAAMTIDGCTVSAGRGVIFRVSGGTVGTTYRIQVTCTTTLADTIVGICPLRIIAST